MEEKIMVKYPATTASGLAVEIWPEINRMTAISRFNRAMKGEYPLHKEDIENISNLIQRKKEDLQDFVDYLEESIE